MAPLDLTASTAALTRYLAADRLESLRRGESLPLRADGSVLVADIGGFSALTRTLAQALGPRRGAETLSQRIDDAYARLVGCIDSWGGVVVSFAGDALSCWFAGPVAAGRARACAAALQREIAAFEALTLKIGIASGPVERWVVGDPGDMRFDLLAGATARRAAEWSARALAGQSLIDEATAQAVAAPVPAGAWPRGAPPSWCPQARPWVPVAVREREQAGLGAFLTELRPTVALFARFSVPDDPDAAQAGAVLDRQVRQLQALAVAQGGAVLQVTDDDKGHYAYACFGAPFAHEDDPLRAVRAAQALVQTLGGAVQVGLGAGVARAGAYGSAGRATYGALGEHVNLAARLMMFASPGQVLADDALVQRLAGRFAWHPLATRAVRGWAQPVTVHALASAQPADGARRSGFHHETVLVGRQAELQRIGRGLAQALAGRAQCIVVQGEAGIGKTRLLGDVLAQARARGFAVHAGECDPAGQQAPFLPWRAPWRSLLALTRGADPDAVRQALGPILNRHPRALQALAPLMDGLADLPDDRWRAEDRRHLRFAIVRDALRRAAAARPCLIVLEDLHWADEASLELLDRLAADRDGSVAFLVTCRPTDMPMAVKVLRQPHGIRVDLGPLDVADTASLVAHVLARHGRAGSAGVAQRVAGPLHAAAGGNPLFIAELSSHLVARGVDLASAAADPASLVDDLPTSLHALTLERVDALPESARAVVKAASVLGRRFSAGDLRGYGAGLWPEGEIADDLDAIGRAGLVERQDEGGDLAFAFRHALTQAAVYECLPASQRASLHERAARWLEAAPGGSDVFVLAHHYGFGTDAGKKRTYLALAGRTAQSHFDNRAALAYFDRLRPLLVDPLDMLDADFRRGRTLYHLGRLSESLDTMRDIRGRAARLGQPGLEASALFEAGKIAFGVSRAAGAFADMQAAVAAWRAQGAEHEHLSALLILAEWHAVLLNVAAVRSITRRVLARCPAPDIAVRARYIAATAVLGTRYHDSLGQALEDAVQQAQAEGDRGWSVRVLSWLGYLEYRRGRFECSGAWWDRCAEAAEEAGRTWIAVRARGSRGVRLAARGDYGAARNAIEETLRQAAPDDAQVRSSFSADLGIAWLGLGDPARAQACFEESLRWAGRMSVPVYEFLPSLGLAHAELARQRLDAARAWLERADAVATGLGASWEQVLVLIGWARWAARVGDGARLQHALRGIPPLQRRGGIVALPAWHASALDGARRAGEQAGCLAIAPST